MSRRTLVIAVVALIAFAGAAALVVADGNGEDDGRAHAARATGGPRCGPRC